MSAPIGVGDWVECVRVDGDFEIALGHIYCVDSAEAQPGPCRTCKGRGETCDRLGLGLVGVREYAPGHRSWCSRAFRPIYRKRDADKLIESLKAPPVQLDAEPLNSPGMTPESEDA